MEIGICLSQNKMNQEKQIRIYIIDCGGKSTVLQNHPSIVHVKNLKEIFDKENVNYEGFQFPVLD